MGDWRREMDLSGAEAANEADWDASSGNRCVGRSPGGSRCDWVCCFGDRGGPCEGQPERALAGETADGPGLGEKESGRWVQAGRWGCRRRGCRRRGGLSVCRGLTRPRRRDAKMLLAGGQVRSGQGSCQTAEPAWKRGTGVRGT